MKTKILVSIPLLFGTSIGFAADPVAPFVEPYLKKKQIPGCAVIVRHEGETVLCAGYGMANLEQDVPVTPQTVFQSGSIGKQFTAVAVLLLAEQEKLSLDDAIGKHIEVPESWKGITIRHLLTHTSGLGDYPESFSLSRDHTEEELFTMVKEQPLGFRPGDKWSYSNLGYVTLGMLIHKVSGKSYADFMRERVFRPLGMTSSRVISEADIIPHRAAGYRFDNGVLKNQKWVAPSVNTTADGSLYLTAEDMAKWAEAMDKEALLSHASYEGMWSPAKLNDGSKAPYGYGWGIPKSGHRVLEHGGAWQGFASYIARFPDDRLTVAVFCNRAGAPARYLGQKIAGMYVTDLAPLARTAIKLDPKKLEACVGSYRLEDRFTVTLKAAGNHLETTWLGESIQLIPGSEVFFFEADADRTFRFVKDESGKVTGMIVSVPEELTFRRLN